MKPPLQRAQTNLLLYSQLAESGWPQRDIQFVHRIYKEVVRLTYGAYRPNWKAFEAHIIGVASLVARDSDSPLRTGAALSHTALQFGRFPPWIRFTKRKAEYLEARIGSDIFAMMTNYLNADWNLLVNPERRPSADETALIHLKLADWLDDLIDELAPVATKKTIFPMLYEPGGREKCVKMAEVIDAPHLKTAYEALLDEKPQEPVIREEHGATFIFKRRL